SKPNQNLFEVYLRLRPSSGSPTTSSGERFLQVEQPEADSDAPPRHITLNPPNDRRRAVEKFAFTQVFEEDATQLDIFHCTGVANLVEGVLAPYGGDGTDALLATLGVTGSGKTHTILGSRTQRGMTQLALDMVFRSLAENLLDCASHPTLEQSISNSDPSEGVVLAASTFIDGVYADAPPAPTLAPSSFSKSSSRAPTPLPSESIGPNSTAPSSRRLHRPSSFPQQPNISALTASCDPSSEYAIVISMYEVYNDRIFDLLTPPTQSAATKEFRRRPLVFKFTESSPDRKVVAGLRKVICGTLQEALLVLEAGLHERRVAGTGSNSVSSRSHGFFCVEAKKRPRTSRRHGDIHWGGSTLTIVDLAGSERARDAKTAGATLAEAGKINESLMYLGQCLQMQSNAIAKDNSQNGSKPGLVPFRQCKLTELLFSNSFPSYSSSSTSSAGRHRTPQKAVMVVTADPLGDYNATSQILRYSALAREVTVPRIPSISQTIASGGSGGQRRPSEASSGSAGPYQHHNLTHNPRRLSPAQPSQSPSQPPHSPLAHRIGAGGGTLSPPLHTPSSDMHRTTMELAALEIARLSEELDYMRQALETERSAREEAESHLLSMEDKLIELEQAIREDCTAEFERRLDIEMARWKATLQVEMERGEEHWGRKIEVFERMNNTLVDDDDGSNREQNYEVYDDDDEDKENVYVPAGDEDWPGEMERLKRENEVLRRELSCLSPSKRRVMPLGERGVGEVGLGGREGSPLGGGGERQGETASLRIKLEGLNVDDAEQRVGGGGSGSGSGSGGNTNVVKKENSDSDWMGAITGRRVGGRKVRRLGGQRWRDGDGHDDADNDDMF
ncbi:P-loop containing nucleoside triphosphate hydrolase protein, partial [Cladorrhinum samala]